MSHAKLGLELGCGTEAVKSAWRALASKHHPDRGGDPQTFSELRSAYSAALADETATEALCVTCEGLGHKKEGSGWTKLKMTCQTCGGTGKKP